MVGQTNLNTYRVSELEKHHISISLNKILSKTILILFKDMPKFFGLDHKDASLIILYNVVIGFSNPKIRLIG